ncbi:selenium metabolism-associated LysR family transcriptional regulator [Hydrogenivirga sp. 128-5-R1-1]|uniref:selenium metabolism-associated LysR family transcriptional regulator n=1 Tax=Hydrogenivirga sp. 128-5-R1-1 TaxID=392423 RepID=UPI00015EF987|nr:selenium metabolism-associated LysR family transcriptional regulator [Hydrogenivirga sp. 128-5-R1-1]EDP75140.1 transcriptional regulator (LysR family) protein [Hydrogenivirga sp. 128-5-R1-1]
MLRDVDLRLLEIFCCVYEKKSLTEATKCLHSSQSTISFHLKNLEKQVGQKLFYRKGKSLVPTTIADRLYDYARELMDFKLRLLEDIGRYSGRKGGVVRIGASSVPGNYILPELLGEFIENYKGNVNVELLIGDSLQIYGEVVKGRLDFGVIGYLPDRSGVEFTEFYEDRIWTVANPELEGRTLSLNELKDIPMVVREEGSGTRRRVEDILMRYGLSLRDMNVVGTFGSNDAVKRALRFVVGFSFLSEHSVRNDNFLIKLKVANFEPIVRKFYMVKDRNRPIPNVAQELMNFLLLRSKTMF